MKPKQFGTFLAAFAAVLSLAVIPAHAVTFTDIANHWAKDYIEDMAERGLAKGWEETGSNGEGLGVFRFDPDRPRSYAETLLFCARAMGISSSVQAEVEDDLGETVREILPEDIASWKGAVREFSVDVAAGVIDLDELNELNEINPASVTLDNKGKVVSSSSYLWWRISREELCLYLVRAMQLEVLAQSLSDYSLDRYEDADQISEYLRPYVYILTNYGIVEGNDQHRFNPKKEVSRAEMTTMLSRILREMERRGISVELSEYTTYPWTGGIIEAAAPTKDDVTVVTLRSPLMQQQTRWSIPEKAEIYLDNMAGSVSDLKADRYVRLNLDSEGRVTSARLGGELSRYDGSIEDLTDGNLTVSTGDGVRTFQIDRFTEVAVGQNVGDRSLIDSEAGYTDAECWLDEMDHLAAVRLEGGTHTVEGLIRSVSAGEDEASIVEVLLFNGVTYTYVIPAESPVTVDGRLRDLTSRNVGQYIQLRVRDETADQATQASVDTLSNYLQGPIKKVGTVGSARGVTIGDVLSGKEETCTVGSSTSIVYYDTEGKKQDKTRADVQKGWYVTVLLGTGENETVASFMAAYPGTVTRDGVLTSISRGETTVLEITSSDESVMNYSLNMEQLPDITRAGKSASIADLRTGDQLELTIVYNEITRIDATAQEADLSGTLTGVHSTLKGTTIEVKLTNGDTETYTVTDTMTISQNGSLTNLSSLKPGQTLALVTNDGKLISVDITASSISASSVAGKVWQAATGSTGDVNILLDDDESTPLRVVVTRDTKILSAVTGETLSLSDLTTGSRITARGGYDSGAFRATVILRE